MLLAIDCGNTNTVFSIWDGTQFIATWRTATEHQRTADQYYVWLSTLMEFQKIEADITDVIVSSTLRYRKAANNTGIYIYTDVALNNKLSYLIRQT